MSLGIGKDVQGSFKKNLFFAWSGKRGAHFQKQNRRQNKQTNKRAAKIYFSHVLKKLWNDKRWAP